MKKILIILTAAMTAGAVMAVPAYRGAISRIASDGTEKEVYLHGDATFHYMTDAEGRWIDEETLEPLSEEHKNLRIQTGKARRQARRVIQETQAAGELNLAPRGLLILANFYDSKFTTPIDTIHNMINGDNFKRSYEYTEKGSSIRITASGSARQYFHDQSWGQYNPVFDVIGPVELPQNVSYYGSNNDANVGNMIKSACELADKMGVDFTQYDNNNDGKVDFVYIIYAGFGEADGGPSYTIWPHNYKLSKNCIVDGKKVENYACSNELNFASKQYAGIGTFCHEFSHVLGLPDLYETNEDVLGLHTLLQWDILDYGPYNNGGNTPPAYSAYERFYCGWLKPRVLTQPEYVNLTPLNDSHKALIISATNTHNLVGNDPNPTDFYILECRKKEGWDLYLPGKGLLITHIKYNSKNWKYNSVNNSADNMGVDLMEAKVNGNNSAASTDAFPAGSKNWYNPDIMDYDVTGIKIQSNGNVEFSFRYAPKPPQAIENVEDGHTAHKLIREGKVIILRNGEEYDMNGRKL